MGRNGHFNPDAEVIQHLYKELKPRPLTNEMYLQGCKDGKEGCKRKIIELINDMNRFDCTVAMYYEPNNPEDEVRIEPNHIDVFRLLQAIEEL